MTNAEAQKLAIELTERNYAPAIVAQRCGISEERARSIRRHLEDWKARCGQRERGGGR